jgi:hypothetical protein
LAADPASADMTVDRGTEFAPAGQSKFGNSVMTFIFRSIQGRGRADDLPAKRRRRPRQGGRPHEGRLAIVITGPDGTRYRPFEFDRLALSAFASD